MELHILLFVGGLFLLTVGAKWVVASSGNIALSFGIQPFIIGVSIIAFGTSLPELVFNIAAQINHSSDLGLGNIIGSNMANLALVLGASAIIRPIRLERRIIKREFPILLAITIIFYLFSLDHIISRTDGFIMLILMGLYVFYLVKSAGVDPDFTIPIAVQDKEHQKKKWMDGIKIIAGLVLLITGARFMVESSISIAKVLGISELVIGLTIVAVGTSLPELAASISASYHNESDLSVGNVIGSNIINILLIIGMISAADSITIKNPLTLSLYFPLLLGLTLILFFVILFRGKLSRTEGIILVLFYFVYTYLCYRSN